MWIATPGHTPGHISLFCDDGRVLVAGDAVITHHLPQARGRHRGITKYGPACVLVSRSTSTRQEKELNRLPAVPGHVRNSSHVQALPEDGSVPFLDEWMWIATPGHTPGHISLFRDDGRVLVAGDA